MTRTIWLALAAGTLLMVGATIFVVSGKGGDSEMHAPVYSDKLVEAKLGPTTFAFPMNLYTHQSGPDFQGGVSLTLRWPTLDAFPPNAVNEAAFKQPYMDESVDISPSYIDKVPIEALPGLYTSASYANADDPIEQLSQRNQAELIHGLTLYVVDQTKLAKYFRERAYPSSPDRLLEASEDWYVERGNNGNVVTFIACDNRQIPGAGLVDGKLEQTPAGKPRGSCRHSFTIPESKLVVHVTYLRAYLGGWKRIETRVREIFAEGKQLGMTT